MRALTCPQEEYEDDEGWVGPEGGEDAHDGHGRKAYQAQQQHYLDAACHRKSFRLVSVDLTAMRLPSPRGEKVCNL